MIAGLSRLALSFPPIMLMTLENMLSKRDSSYLPPLLLFCGSRSPLAAKTTDLFTFAWDMGGFKEPAESTPVWVSWGPGTLEKTAFIDRAESFMKAAPRFWLNFPRKLKESESFLWWT